MSAPSGRDIDGQTRIQGYHVDIGADESDGTQWDTTPVIVYADPAGSDNNNGRSWTSPKKSIKAALDAISLTGGEVWAKERTASESNAADNRTLVIRPFCYLYGGLGGTRRSAPSATGTSMRPCLTVTAKGP